jgi:hypothetical protein
MSEASDIPRGTFGRLLGIRRPALEPDEEVQWSAWANRYQGKFFNFGGCLFLTDRRLIFAPNKANAFIGGKDWSAPLSHLNEATTRGLLKTIHVAATDGAVERFTVRSSEEAAQILSRAFEGK